MPPPTTPPITGWPACHPRWVCFGRGKPPILQKLGGAAKGGIWVIRAESEWWGTSETEAAPAPVLPPQGARASPGPTPPAGDPWGSTHQLGQEEGVGDGEEQHDPQGHFGRGVAGGGRQVRGGHLSPTAWCPWLRSGSPAPPRQISPPARHTHRTSPGRKKKRSSRAGPSTRSSQKTPH